MSFSVLWLSIFYLVSYNIFAQDLALEDWRDHLPYGQTHSITKSPTRVYCAAKNSIFYLDLTDNTVNRITTRNGLSDVQLAKIAYVPSTRILLITYLNGNIDLMREDGRITNVSFIKNSTITGSKEIFQVTIEDEFAYLSTGFGIVVFDTKRVEIKDTYFVGTSTDLLEVYDVALSADSIFAATERGLYQGSRADNLADYRTWSRINTLPSRAFNILTWMDDRLMANEEGDLNITSDTLYIRSEGGIWGKYGSVGDTGSANTNFDIVVVDGEILVPQQFAMWIFDEDFQIKDKIFTYSNIISPQPREVLKIGTEYWVADAESGMVRFFDSFRTQLIKINSPSTERTFDLAIQDGILWSVAGGYTQSFVNLFFPPILNTLQDYNWDSYGRETNEEIEETFDLVSIEIDPFDSKRVFASSWGRGLIEFYDNQILKTYTVDNLFEHSLGIRQVDSAVFVGDLDFDQEGNLWMSNPFNFNLISVLTAEGDWRSFNLQGKFNVDAAFSDILADRFNNIWVLQNRDNRIVVYNHNGTPLDQSDDPEPLVLSNTAGQGDLPGDYIFCVEEDLNGEVWVGTDEGVAVFYNASGLFNGGNVDAQQILIQQDGTTQILFETESITCIAIDGANRKWIGTLNAGAFLMSADGTTQIEHFTTDNSPLLSNNIGTIAIDGKTGEVFFGTENGLISYRGTATEAVLEIDEVEVFPNPVKKDYRGPIAIRGLTQGAVVKITDARGGLVYETLSQGGQAVWNGNNFKGERVETGVYLIFSASSDGEQTNVSKVMILN